ncbi:hypothetical protein MNB_SV-13-130 [hydrothermal vent metagenome]|uniref:Uncharacterized protein n=1 Tax=hydrothermal vent metagenome TaxID=652676 RepID=A0A1W1CYH1_9ZZZZ
MPNREQGNEFNSTLAYSLMKPSTNIFDPIAKTVSNLGTLADKQEAKEKSSLEFNQRQGRIKQKIEDNSKLAKMFNSGLDFNSFTKEHGEFSTPSVAKIARDFSDKNKSMMNNDELKIQWSSLSANPKFKKAEGTFDFAEATNHVARKLRRGEIEPLLASKLIDGLHKQGGYGIYSVPKAPKSKKLVESGKAKLLAKAFKIKDPQKQKEAIAQIENVNDLAGLGALGAMVQQYDTDASITLDKKKASQKYANQVGNFLSTSNRLESLIDNYSPEFTGMLDTAQENALQGTNFADPNYTAYKKQMGTVFLDFKELNNMGASFTESEQKMMRNAMPNLDSSDDEYKRDMIEFTKVIRDKVKSKIIALDSANYNTGELKKVTDYYDNLVKKAEAKFGAKKNNSTSDSKQTLKPTQIF